MGRKKWERERESRRETWGELGETKGIKNQEYSKPEMENHGKREGGGRGVKLRGACER